MSLGGRSLRSLLLLGFALPPFVLLPTSSVEAAVWHVYPDGSGDAPTIAAAIDSSSVGDRIVLHAGDYHEWSLPLKSGTTLESAEPSPADVVIHGEAFGPPILNLTTSEALPQTTIRGLTLMNSRIGVHSVWPVRVRVDGCVIRDCDVGVATIGGILEVEDCEIIDGKGGVRTWATPVSEGTVLIRRTSIRSGSSGLYQFGAYFEFDYEVDHVTFQIGGPFGRGIWTVDGASGSVSNCSFTGGSTGFYGDGGAAELDSCFFSGGTNSRVGTAGGHEIIVRHSMFRDSYRALGIDASSSATAIDCDFIENAYGVGGAVSAEGNVLLDRCRFRGNWANSEGGAIYVGAMGEVVAEHCSFVGDGSPKGAFASVLGTLELNRCLVASDPEGDAALFLYPQATIRADCCVLYGNGPGLTMTPILGDSLVSADPLLCTGTDFTIADLSPGAPAFSACGELVGVGEVGCSVSGVYVDSEPGGLRVLGDGEAKWAAAFFPWGAGETHQVSAPESLFADDGVLYTFAEWDDGGDRTHDVAVTSDRTVATARFDRFFELTMEAEGSGSVTPVVPWQVPGSTVWIEAVPDSGWVFERWWGDGAGSYGGVDSLASVVMHEPLLQHAVFIPGVPVTIHSVPEGRTVLVGDDVVVTPATFLWGRNRQMFVDANSPQEFAPGERYRFVSWSDGGDEEHFVPVGTTPVELTVEYTLEYALTFDPEEHATITPGDTWHAPGAVVSIEAIADWEWEFGAWVGAGDDSYSGMDNPAQVTINGPVQQDAVIVAAFEGHGYDFTISASSTDPFVNEAPPAGGVRSLYLWGTCLQRGLAAFEAQVTGTIPVAHFEAAPGVLNAGDAEHLFLAVADCPLGNDANFLIGHWLAGDFEGGTLCLTSPDGAPFAAADCTPDTPVIWPDPGLTGFSSDGSPPCDLGTNGCLEDPVLVQLSGLRAEPADGTVIVSWETALELNHDGFHVYRSMLGGGEPTRRTQSMIRGRSPYAWVDRDVEADHTYRYWVGAIDHAGREQRFGPVEVTTPRPVPSATRFAGPRPTPFRGRTRMAFSLAEEARVELTIFDVAGRVVRRYADLYNAGEHTIEWDARGGDGRPAPGGVYFATFRAGDVRETRKLVLLPR